MCIYSREDIKEILRNIHQFHLEEKFEILSQLTQLMLCNCAKEKYDATYLQDVFSSLGNGWGMALYQSYKTKLLPERGIYVDMWYHLEKMKYPIFPLLTLPTHSDPPTLDEFKERCELFYYYGNIIKEKGYWNGHFEKTLTLIQTYKVES